MIFLGKFFDLRIYTEVLKIEHIKKILYIYPLPSNFQAFY